MSTVTASSREIHNQERLVCKRFEVFEVCSNGLVHGNLGGLHLQIELLRHTVSKGIATERCNFFFKLGFFFLLLFDGSSTQVLQLLLVALANGIERILRELERVSRISNLGGRFLDTQNKVVHVEFGLELVADTNKLVGKLKTEQVRELGVVRRIAINGHFSTRRSRSLGNRLSTSNRVNVSLDLFAIAFSHHSAIRAGFFVTLTGDCRVALANSLQGIRNHLGLEVRVFARLHIVKNTLDYGVLVKFFAHLARNNRKVLATELGTQHIGELFIVSRISGNGGRPLFDGLFTTCHKTKCSQCRRTKSNFLHVHIESP